MNSKTAQTLWVAALGAACCGQQSSFRFAAYGDTRNGHEVHADIVRQVIEAKPALVIQTGDLVASGANAGDWRKFDEITAELRKSIPYYPVRGNHDLGGPGYEERMTARYTSGNRLYYSFDHGGVHFAAIDSQQPIAPDSAQYKWLALDLRAAHARRRTIVAFMHSTVYSVGPHGSNKGLQKDLLPLFRECGVKLIFQGHDHIYYRTVRDGITYVVTGGGGAPLYPVYPDRAIPGDRYEQINHFCICDVGPRKISVRVVRRDGTIADRFDVTR